MKKSSRYIILLASISLLIINGVQLGSAWFPTYQPTYIYPVEITYANYLDTDNDGYEDDILTEFMLKSPTGQLCYMEADLTLYLTLPSGRIFYIHFYLEEVFVELNISVQWLNCAIEEGWYDFEVVADIYGYDLNYWFEGVVSDIITFDPPKIADPGAAPSAIVAID